MRKALAVLFAVSIASGAWAAGGGGSGGSGGGGSGGGGGSPVTKTCDAGKVYDKKAKKCVKKSAARLSDRDLIAQGWVLAKSGKFEAGRELFAAVAAKNNAEALNGLGFTNRKLGNFKTAIGYYMKALAIDPNYLDAREYLGEGYASVGKLDLARQQLAEIEQRGGKTAEQYLDLAKAIDEAVKNASAN